MITLFIARETDWDNISRVNSWHKLIFGRFYDFWFNWMSLISIHVFVLLQMANFNRHTNNFLCVLIILTSEYRLFRIIQTEVDYLLNHFKWRVWKLFEIYIMIWLGCNQNREFNNFSLTNFKNAFDFNKGSDWVLNLEIFGSYTVSQTWLRITWFWFWHHKCLGAFLNREFIDSTSSNI